MTKNHIILEIQRAARENGGKPLGRLKFLRMTGIKETDWSGKYWARWSDALKDAGFGPNQLQQPYDDSVLFDRFVGLVRELGRVPVVTEMRMKSGRHYKIGRTNSLGRREWELGIKISIPPKTIHSIETDDPVGVEAYWHKRFSDKRGEGEWFDLSPDDIKAFKRWKRIM